jgi:phosphinothricin acetyltransferase
MLEAIDAAGVHRALAAIALPNDASVGLHERFGFRFVGRLTEVGWKFDRFWDVAWYERGPLTIRPTAPPM